MNQKTNPLAKAMKWLAKHLLRRKGRKAQRPLTDEQYNANRHRDHKRVDAILDKISRSGYKSLTKEERAILSNYR